MSQSLLSMERLLIFAAEYKMSSFRRIMRVLLAGNENTPTRTLIVVLDAVSTNETMLGTKSVHTQCPKVYSQWSGLLVSGE